MTESTSPGGSEHPAGRLLYRGAEADVIRGDWQGLEAVYKVRKPLRYRLPVLDEEIRRQRTLHEAEMIHQAKGAGVAAPYLYDVDPPASTLVMEYVEGTRLKDVIASKAEGTDEVFREFGRNVGLLHRAGIMHGDLTTANVVRRGGSLVFVDFGLSIRTERLEDHAVDLRLIKETLLGAHPQVAAAAMEALNRGYAGVLGPARSRAVFRQLLSIERRGRYARVA
ncbi:MAG: Kae1-associated serine/threonine protein kinase [Nitrososphaerota archaeon]|nr:Kae1-associated serine/threonine protein kinase [Nitrososphaerota archaeon]MDG7024249.1 Kae1-associated serine/threonine protein kinase [Nitrososphaerota archaeon]